MTADESTFLVFGLRIFFEMTLDSLHFEEVTDLIIEGIKSLREC